MNVYGHLCGATELAVELSKQMSVTVNPLDADLVLDIDFSGLILQKIQDFVIRNQVERNLLEANKPDQSCP